MSPDEVRNRRLELGLTQAQLARALGVTSSTVSNWENGRTGISPSMALMLNSDDLRPTQEYAAYRLLDTEGNTRYVGYTCNWEARKLDHLAKPFYRESRRAIVEYYATKDEAFEREHQLMLEYRPTEQCVQAGSRTPNITPKLQRIEEYTK